MTIQEFFYNRAYYLEGAPRTLDLEGGPRERGNGAVKTRVYL